MKRIIPLALFTSLFAFGPLSALADHTNRVQELAFQLVGFKQGATSSSGHRTTTSLDYDRIGTAEVIGALGKATGSGFSRRAKLVLVTSLPDGAAKLEVRDGSGKVDVTRFFVYERSGSVKLSEYNSRTGRGFETEYGLLRFALKDNDLDAKLGVQFDVSGLVTDTSFTTPAQGTTADAAATVTGAGDKQNDWLILQGSVQIHGNTLEIIANGPVPNV